MVRYRRPPSQTWRTFLDNHLTQLVSIDFEQADHVANKMEQRVPIELFWAIGLPVASHIWRDRMESSFCERMQLMAPRIP
jgi:hypothetical protein